MVVNFPPNCNSEGSRWSYTVKLNQTVIDAHNAEGNGTTSEWREKIKAVHTARNEQIEIAKTTKHWDLRIPDHVQNGVITYPGNLNQANEGSRGSFLLKLSHKLMLDGRTLDDIDVLAVDDALSQAKEDAINGTYWSPSLGDIGAD